VRIIFVNWHDWFHTKAGGAEIYLKELVQRLSAAGNEIMVVCSNSPGHPAQETLDGIRFIRLGNRYNFNFKYYRQAKKIIREFSPDIIIDDQNKLPLLSPLFTDRPVICMIMHLFKKAIFRESIFPIALGVYIAEKLIPRIYRNCQFTVLGQSGKNDIEGMGITPEHIHVIEPGVDLSNFLPAMTHDSYFLCLGRLRRYKSVDHIFIAMDLLRAEGIHTTLKVVGTGDDSARLKKIARKLRLEDQVEFTGYVTNDRALELYQRAYAIIQPSRKEGWGLSVIEAGACQVPAIAADVEGLRDSVRHEQTGFLYEWGNIEQLSAAMKRLIQDVPLRERLAEGNLQWSARFTWDQAAGKLIDLISTFQK